MARNAKRMKLDAITEDDRIIAYVVHLSERQDIYINHAAWLALPALEKLL
jgi:hypothetical protein